MFTAVWSFDCSCFFIIRLSSQISESTNKIWLKVQTKTAKVSVQLQKPVPTGFCIYTHRPWINCAAVSVLFNTDPVQQKRSLFQWCMHVTHFLSTLFSTTHLELLWRHTSSCMCVHMRVCLCMSMFNVCKHSFELFDAWNLFTVTIYYTCMMILCLLLHMWFKHVILERHTSIWMDPAYAIRAPI